MNKINFYIFGNSDATRRLILPNLNAYKNNVYILDPEVEENLIYKNVGRVTKNNKAKTKRNALYDNIRFLKLGGTRNISSVINKNKNNIYIVASPTSTHYRYIKKLGKKGVVFWCEKPLTLSSKEYEKLRKNKTLLKNMFCLTYYSLDKGLPLTYLYSTRHARGHSKNTEQESPYNRFLNIENFQRKNLPTVFEDLGEIKEINFNFIEELKPNQIKRSKPSLLDIEDLIFHPFMILSQIVGVESRVWFKESHVVSQNYENKSEIVIKLLVKKRPGKRKVPVNMVVCKKENSIHKTRSCSIIYEHGEVFMDFDTKNLKIYVNSTSENTTNKTLVHKISVRNKYQTNYKTLIKLAETWSKNPKKAKHDLLENQLWGIKYYLQFKHKNL